MRVKEIHDTIQGEGYHTGHRVILVRLSGCNVWNGKQEDRGKGRARCSLWCDTDFVGTSGHRGGEYSPAELCGTVLQLWGENPHPVILLTGGEPGLQLRAEFISACRESGIALWVETNGSIPLPEGIDWVTCSPKDPLSVTQTQINEVKLVFPGDDPERYAHLASNLYLQPLSQDADAVTKCVEYIRKDSKWRLSLQTHKYISLP